MTMPLHQRLRGPVGLPEGDSAGEHLLGSFVQLPSPEVVELYGLAGFDFVILDLEHGAFAIDGLSGLIRAAEARGVAPLVRIHELSASLVSKVLDLGAVGVMVPHVRSAADVAAMVAAAKYAPDGSRGYCSGVRGVDYLAPPTFTAEANARTLVLPLIENLSAYDDYEAILEVDGVDGVMIGPGDLSAALGAPGRWDDEPVRPVLEDLVRRAVAKGVPVGMHVKEPAHAADWLRRGVRFFTYGMDAQVILRHLTSIREAVTTAGRQG